VSPDTEYGGEWPSETDVKMAGLQIEYAPTMILDERCATVFMHGYQKLLLTTGLIIKR
jgi:hypothetical protein